MESETVATLRARIVELERENAALRQREAAAAQEARTLKSLPTLNDKQRDIFKRFQVRRIAFKFAYIGIDYQGVQYTQGVTNTVEERLYYALRKTLLVEDPLRCNYSRSGRTDKGVSALGNVFAADVRTTIPAESDPNTPVRAVAPLDYVRMINACLPQDVRVLAWAEAPGDFNARHHCQYRVYKYFFLKNGMDLERMRAASALLIGEHDFRTFCKIDVLNTTNFVRSVLEVTIEEVPSHGRDRDQLCCATIRGTAFLYHQIRCIMAVLFAVGKHQEEPEIVTQLLDTRKYPARPAYAIADDYPLILYDCHYDALAFNFDDVAQSTRLYDHFRQIFEKRVIETSLLATCMAYVVQRAPGVTQQSVNAEKAIKYKKIAALPLTQNAQEQISGLKGKKLQKFEEKQKRKQEYAEQTTAGGGNAEYDDDGDGDGDE